VFYYLGRINHFHSVVFQSIYLVFEEMLETQQDWLHRSHLISVACCLFCQVTFSPFLNVECFIFDVDYLEMGLFQFCNES